MKNLLTSIVLLASSFSVYATPVTVDFSFDAIAIGSFTYDSSLDGGVIGYSDLDSFSLTFSGPTSSVYDLAFINSGNDTVHRYLGFDSSVDMFAIQSIAGYPTTMSDIKNGYSQGFFARDDVKIVRDYVGGGNQYYNQLSVSVDRAVPEPTTLALLALGLVSFGFANKKRQA
ncbi:MAG: PEP-CTERM sorting domain-containing protein [Gammaproteobacteria bacterium]|nr:PEP-CTERM sorting domain-containing protein [Gammaproteobacteria bacterium]